MYFTRVPGHGRGGSYALSAVDGKRLEADCSFHRSAIALALSFFCFFSFLPILLGLGANGGLCFYRGKALIYEAFAFTWRQSLSPGKVKNYQL